MGAGAVMVGLGFGLLLMLLGSRKSHASEAVAPVKPTPIRLPPVVVTPETLDEETQKDIQSELDAEKVKLPKSFPTPNLGTIKPLSPEKWTNYVTSQRGGKLNTITAGYSLGIWLMGMRVLQDLGYAKNVKLQDYKGKQVFMGDWVSPHSLQGFLNNAALQYEAFRRMTENHAKYIKAKHGALIDNSEGRISLSGLLAVAKQAGLKGMDEWIAKPETRKPATTAQFDKANGIF
jgi:hypothetical protein